MELAATSYKLTELLPKSEVYGPCRPDPKSGSLHSGEHPRAHGREHLGDYLHHLSVANGSLIELVTHFLIANRLAYLGVTEIETLLELFGGGEPDTHRAH
jgi:hypothetical protein